MHIFKHHQIFSLLQQYLPATSVIVEVGAFMGQDTIRLAQHFAQSTIHAFEPVPQLFEQLQQNTKTYPNIHCYNYALSSTTGTAPLHVAHKPNRPEIPTQASSLKYPKERLNWSAIQFPYTITVQTITLADWMTQQQIDHIDCLWLDIQGMELEVLQASESVLSKIQLIYTEVAFIEAYEQQPTFEKIVEWLETTGFTLIGKDFTDTTNWFFGNALFYRS